MSYTVRKMLQGTAKRCDRSMTGLDIKGSRSEDVGEPGTLGEKLPAIREGALREVAELPAERTGVVTVR